MEVNGAVRNISSVLQSRGRIREKFMSCLSSALPLKSIIFLERKWHRLGRRKNKDKTCSFSTVNFQGWSWVEKCIQQSQGQQDPGMVLPMNHEFSWTSQDFLTSTSQPTLAYLPEQPLSGLRSNKHQTQSLLRDSQASHWGTCLGKAKNSLWAEACLTMADQRGFLHLKWWPDYAVYHFQVTAWRKKRHKAQVNPQCAALPPISRLRSCFKPEPSFFPNWDENLILNV